MEGACQDPLGLREGLWDKSSHKGLFWVLRIRRCLPQSSTVDKAQQLVAAVVDLLSGCCQVQSFLSKASSGEEVLKIPSGQRATSPFPFVGLPQPKRQEAG